VKNICSFALILAAVIYSSVAIASLHIHPSESTSPSEFQKSNSWKNDSFVNNIGWQYVDLSNKSIGYYSAWLDISSSYLNYQSIDIGKSTSVVKNVYTGQSFEQGADVYLVGNSIGDSRSLTSTTDHDSSATDSASILLFCFGIGITGLTSMRKKLVKIHNHAIQ